MNWRLHDRIWEMVDESGRVLDSLRHDREGGQYRDGRGVLMGSRWDEARAACEKRAKEDDPSA